MQNYNSSHATGRIFFLLSQQTGESIVFMHKLDFETFCLCPLSRKKFGYVKTGNVSGVSKYEFESKLKRRKRNKENKRLANSFDCKQ